MCGRFVSPEEATIERYWQLGRPNFKLLPRRFNVFPTDTIQFLRRPSNSEGLELAAGRWGLVPHWWKEAKPPKTSFNARVEEAAAKPMWRDAWSRARCLIPAEGWYEWQAGRARRSRDRRDQAGEAAAFHPPCGRARHLLRGLDVLLEKPGDG